MRNLLVVLAMVFSLNVMAQQQKPTAIPGHDGITIFWESLGWFNSSVYRGTSPDNYELLAQNVTSPYLDKTAESGIQYYYKIVAETKDISAMTEIQRDILFIRDFRTEINIGTPAITNSPDNHDLFKNTHYHEDVVNKGVGIGFTNKQLATYERYLSNVVTGKQYIAKITFGGVKGNCSSIRLSLSARKPVADVVINSPGKELQDTTQEYTLVGGPSGWNTFHLGVQAGNSGGCTVYVKRIEVFGK